MRKTKLVILSALILVSGLSFAQKQTVRMKTLKPLGDDITFVVNASACGLKVDWGDGVTTEVQHAPHISPLLKIEGKVQGESIQLLCDENLTFLDCEQCELTELDLQGARTLHSLYCAHNELTALDLRKMHHLVDLDCSYNELKKIILTSYDSKKAGDDLPLIERLDISHNNFASSYNWHLPSIRQLNISGNKFTSIYINDVTLQFLNFSDNQLRGNLNLEKLVNLQSLLTYNNQHTVLTLYNKGEKVQQLFCDSNKLQSLDLEQATGLKDLSCSENGIKQLLMPVKMDLSSLNVSGNCLDFSVLPSKRTAPEYLSFMPQEPFGFTDVDGIMFKDNVPYAPLSESWSRRHCIDLTSQGTLIGKHYDAEYTWYSVREDGSVNEMTQRKSPSGTEDFYFNRGKTAFFIPYKKAYVKMVSKSYGYAIKSVPIAIGDDVTAIEHITLANGGIKIEVKPSHLLFTGNGSVTIFTPAGKCVWRGIIQGREQVELPKGIYIVNNVKVVL